MAKMKKALARSSDEPEHDILKADWELMRQINDVLAVALQKFIDDRIRRKLGGIDITTMFMAVQNWHVLMVVEMGSQLAPTDPFKRKDFYVNARESFDAAINNLLQRLSDDLLQAAMHEADHARVSKEGAN